MGLDMYLSAGVFVAGYEFNGKDEQERFGRLVELSGLNGALDPETPTATLYMTVAYWRKSNMIHKWFVDNVQGGVDECQRSLVSSDQLQELRDLCQQLLDLRLDDPGAAEALATEKLPPQAGFFFGGTELDEWYWRDLADTVTQLDRALSVRGAVDYEYQASW